MAVGSGGGAVGARRAECCPGRAGKPAPGPHPVLDATGCRDCHDRRSRASADHFRGAGRTAGPLLRIHRSVTVSRSQVSSRISRLPAPEILGIPLRHRGRGAGRRGHVSGELSARALSRNSVRLPGELTCATTTGELHRHCCAALVRRHARPGCGVAAGGPQRVRRERLVNARQGVRSGGAVTAPAVCLLARHHLPVRIDDDGSGDPAGAAAAQIHRLLPADESRWRRRERPALGIPRPLNGSLQRSRL